MYRIILILIGAAAILFGAGMLLKMSLFLKRGKQCVAEILSSEKDRKGRFTHKVKFRTVDGDKEIIAKDRAGYNNAFKDGETKIIVYNTEAPEEFRFLDEFGSSRMAYISCIIVGVLFVLRFILI